MEFASLFQWVLGKGVLIFGLATVFASLRTFWNIFFHPLARVPGPFWSKVSAVPSSYHALRGDRHLWLRRLFATYGNKIRVTPNTIIWNDPKAYADIYNNKANVQRDRFYVTWQKDEKDINTITTADKADHARRRKFLAQAFTEKSVRAASDFFIKHINRWHELIAPPAGWSATLNMADLADSLIFDIMGDLSFGKSFDIKEPGANPLKAMPHAIHEYLSFNYPMGRSPFLSLLLFLKPRGLNAFLARLTPPAIKEYYKFVNNSVRERFALQDAFRADPEKTSSHRKDMFHFLCEAHNDDGTPAYTPEDIFGEANLLIIAGSDTTSLTLSGAFFYLTRNLTALERLTAEIREAFAEVEDIIPGTELQCCAYLKAVIDETLRLTPTIPSEMPREVLEGGLFVKGEYIPVGTTVGCSFYCDSLNKSVYGSDAEFFRPERWLAEKGDEKAEERVTAMKRAFRPFAAGPGMCLGKNFALAELQLSLARTVWRFDVRRAAGEKQVVEKREGDIEGLIRVNDSYLAMRDGPLVQLKRREV